MFYNVKFCWNLIRKICDYKFTKTFNKLTCTLIDSTNASEKNQDIFVKFSPLLDPVKYLVGKYDYNDVNIFNLPKLDNNRVCHEKVKSVYNSAYTDSFFSFLTSKLLNEHGFIHGLDFYGSYLANLSDYKVPINIQNNDLSLPYVGRMIPSIKFRGLEEGIKKVYSKLKWILK